MATRDFAQKGAIMPLLDHFHPPVSERRPWTTIHGGWAFEMMAQLNRALLPKGYFAAAEVVVTGRVEIDVGTFEEPIGDGDGNGDTGAVAVQTATQTITQPLTLVTIPAIFPDEYEVRVFREEGGATLVAAVEVVSPGNKDRPEARRAFAAKCASYLQAGVGLVIVDVVTERLANLHDELMRVLEQQPAFAFPPESPLYAVAYRPKKTKTAEQIDIRPYSLAVGQKLPVVPLSLSNGPTVPLDLESSYEETKLRSRL
jgi:hypothetical protein